MSTTPDLTNLRGIVHPHVQAALALLETADDPILAAFRSSNPGAPATGVPLSGATAHAHLALVMAHLMDALTAVQAEADRLEPDPPAFVPEPTAEPRVITWDKLEALYDRGWTGDIDNLSDAFKHAGAPSVWRSDLRQEIEGAYMRAPHAEDNDDGVHKNKLWAYVQVLSAHGVTVTGAPEWVTA